MAEHGALTAKEVAEAVKKHTQSGMLLSESGADCEALDHYKKAYAHVKQLNSPKTQRLCALNLAAAYLSLSKYKLAEKYLNRALEQSGGEAARLIASSKCTFATSTSAARSFTVTGEPNGDLFYNIALLNERRQSFLEAESWYETALAEYARFEPTSYYAIGVTNEKLARLAQRTNRARDALTRFEAAKCKFEAAIDAFINGLSLSQCEPQLNLKLSVTSRVRESDIQECVIHAITCYYAALYIVRKLNDAVGKQSLADSFINLLQKLAANRVRLNLKSAPMKHKTDLVASLHLGVIYYDVSLFCVENRQLEKALTCLEAALEHIRTEPDAPNDPDAPFDDGSGAPFAKATTKQPETRYGRFTVRERYEPAIQQNLGALYNAVGDYQRSIAFHERAAALFTRLAHNLPSEAPDWKDVQFDEFAKRLQRSSAQCYANLAFACYSTGQLDSAYAVYETALSSARAAQDVRTEWQALEALAILCIAANRLDEAVSFLQDAVIAVGNDPLAVTSRNRYAANDADSLVYSDYTKIGAQTVPVPVPVPEEDVYYVQNTDDPAQNVSSEQRKLVEKLSMLLERVVARNSHSQKARRRSAVAPDSFTIPHRLLLTVNSHLAAFTQRANHHANLTSSLLRSLQVNEEKEKESVFPFSRWSLDSYRPRLTQVVVRNTLPSLHLTTCPWPLSDDDAEDEVDNVNDDENVVPNRFVTVSAAPHDIVKLSDADREDTQLAVDDAADEDEYEMLKPTYTRISVERVSSPVNTDDYGCVAHRHASPPVRRTDVTSGIEGPPIDMESHPSRSSVPPDPIEKSQRKVIVEQTVDDSDYPGCNVQSTPINAPVRSDSKRPIAADAPVYSTVIRENDRNLHATGQQDEDESEGDETLEDEQDPLEEIDNTDAETLLKNNETLPPTEPSETTKSDVAYSQQKACSSSVCLIL